MVGCAHMIRDEAVTEALRGVAADFLLVDMQHAAFGLESLQRTLIALHPSELAVLVRIPSNDHVTIGQMFDLGVTGVIVPMVNTREDALAAVAAAKYPPDGIRSWGPRRVATFHGDAASYALSANDSTLIIAQVETQEAVDNLDDIISVPGLSGIMVGPADLAIS
ncbi:2-dehydro-3-deoxyglucarate aldolase, partial [mine drainage metagenome]